MSQTGLPHGFHPEIRPGLGPVIVCSACDEIMRYPDPP
jgi:hypothetical protein